MAESREPWPDLFINGAQRSVRDDVLTWLSSLRSVGPGTLITVVTGYLSVRGLLTATSVLRDAVRSGAHVRILLGVGPHEQVRIVAPAVDPRAERETLRRLLHRGRTAITAEVDAIPQSRPDSLALYGLAQLLRHPHVACRSVHKGHEPVPEELPLLPDSAIRQHWQHRDQIAAAHRDGTSDNHRLELDAWIAPTPPQ